MARESTIGSTFHLETLPAAATSPITAIEAVAATTSTPARATISTTLVSAVKGDFVEIAGTGLKALDRLTMHRVADVDTGGGTVTIDTDISDDTIPGTITGTIRKVTLKEVCFAEFGVDTPAPSEIDVTTMCDTSRRNVPGLASPGSASFGGPLDLDDAGQQLLITAYNDAKPRNMVWMTRGGQTGLLYGVVSAFSGAPQGVEQAVTFSGNFQVQEAPIYLAPLV